MGVGCPHGARLALHVMITFALSEGATIAMTTLLVLNVWGKLYSREEVIRYVATCLNDATGCIIRLLGWIPMCTFRS